MRFTSAFRRAAFTLVLWTGFAAAALAQRASSPGGEAQASPAAAPAAPENAPATAAKTDLSDCIDQNGDFATSGKTNNFVFTLANKCEQRLKCTIDAYVTGAKGPSSGHGTLILAPKSQGAAAKKSYTMKVKMAAGTAEVSRTCKVF